MIPLSDETRPNRTPLVTYLLLAANIVIYFMATEADIDLYGLHAGDLLAGTNFLNVITSMFLHGSLLHVIFNIWSLWIFGDNVEDDLGHIKYLVLYLVSGVVGGYLFALFAEPEAIAIGASGAISGVMGAYLILHPRNRVLALIPLGFFITTARISAPVFIGLWFLLQFIGFTAATETGIAYSAHIGGFLAGLILAWLLKPSRPKVEVVQ